MNEAKEQKQLLTWVKIQYPNLLYTEDMGGIRLTIGQAVKVKKSRCRPGHPDMMFQKLFLHDNQVAFVGLAMEFKRTGEKIIKKNGDYVKSSHLEEQRKYLLELSSQGWFVCFALGFKEASKIIKTYIKQDLVLLNDLAQNIYPKVNFD